MPVSQNLMATQPLPLNASEKLEFQLLELQARYGNLTDNERDRLMLFKFLNDQPMAPGMPDAVEDEKTPRRVKLPDFSNPRRRIKSKFMVR